MKSFVKTVLLIVNIISFIFTMLVAIFGIYEQIMGPANAEKMLKMLHIPLSYNQMFIFGCICAAILIITYFVRIKLFRK